jgi:hypothetical protein
VLVWLAHSPSQSVSLGFDAASAEIQLLFGPFVGRLVGVWVGGLVRLGNEGWDGDLRLAAR